jgi:very-short-patch-repair endonuclease
MSNALRLSEDQLREIVQRFKRVAPYICREEVAPPVQPKARARRGPSELELLFSQQLTLMRIPNPKREHHFIESRDFRLDFAWPPQRIGVEVQGMVHRIKGRFSADIEKRALGLLAGWRVLEVGGAEIRSGRAIAWLIALLDSTQ